MKKATTRVNYQQRISLVIEHIWNNLECPLDINRLADIACFSPYHFHRLYRGMLGETVSNTIRRLRLHHASSALLRSEQAVETIAKRFQYSGATAFIRAFVKQYGLTPEAYRQAKPRLTVIDKPNFIPQEFSAMFDVTYTQLEDINLAYLPHQGDYMNIGSTFEQLFSHAAGQGLMGADTRSFGLYYDDPASVATDKIRSEACLTASNATSPLETKTLGTQKYVAIVFKGPYAELETAYNWLYRQWLPEQQLELANAPVVEEYLNNPRELPPTEWLTRIHIPIA
ncbi:AraC family transcriptional regulator [Algibacillus agarilyticus]|uniref:AraC family transcriptional regulator n=1 Tax=Algibacillus agarilyticus TaxID=2234133 RepID=UPI000DD0DD0B|nr:AraC family transcriptional regulator [Algibacillus agarilyticus]